MGRERVLGVFYQGSGNYGLDYDGSDVDTKCIVLPTLEQLITGKTTNYTHIRDNDEHIDFKDIRLMFETFRKCNLNYIEIMFTKYFVVNEDYAPLWDVVRGERNYIVSLGRGSLLKSIRGIAGEKWHAMEHRYPSRIEWLDAFGYDPKQLHHLLRIQELLTRYLDGEALEDCLVSKTPEYLVDVKVGKYSLDEARQLGKCAFESIQKLCADNEYTVTATSIERIDKFFDAVSYDSIHYYIKNWAHNN